MNIVFVTSENQQEVVDLLKQNQLPTSDITNTTLLYAFYEADKLKGTVGLEVFNKTGLLRSLCVTTDVRKAGYGQQLVRFIEEEARKKGILELYLLTTTATAFFMNRGYSIVDRSTVPASIQQTAQFSTICSKTATIMKKQWT